MCVQGGSQGSSQRLIKQSFLETCSESLEYYHSDKTFLQQIVTGDETWIHHFKPESKRASMEWPHPTSPCPKRFKSQQYAGKVMVTVFWDSVGVILVDFMCKGATINSDVYINLPAVSSGRRLKFSCYSSVCQA